MILRRSRERGQADHGWLRSFHTFSFADYHDPRHMGFRSLRVINEDTVQPGRGFGTHPHRDMEIITYVLEGAVAHKDSMGNGSTIRPGDVQRMTAGTGITHSEYNPSQHDLLHFLQIWILPAKQGLEPSYEQKHFSSEEKHNRLRLVASSNGEEGSITVHQDARLYAGCLDEGAAVIFQRREARHLWAQLASGKLQLNEEVVLEAGDALATSDAPALSIRALEPSELLLFDLA